MTSTEFNILIRRAFMDEHLIDIRIIRCDIAHRWDDTFEHRKEFCLQIRLTECSNPDLWNITPYYSLKNTFVNEWELIYILG